MSKFKGVVYFSGSDLPVNWGAKAVKVLTAGSECEVVRKTAPAEEVKITVAEHSVHLFISEGSVNGHVTESPSAGALVVCLVALRRHIGGIALVGDDSEFFSGTVRQSNKLYCNDWDRVARLAHQFELMGSPLSAECAAILAAMF